MSEGDNEDNKECKTKIMHAPDGWAMPRAMGAELRAVEMAWLVMQIAMVYCGWDRQLTGSRGLPAQPHERTAHTPHSLRPRHHTIRWAGQAKQSHLAKAAHDAAVKGACARGGLQDAWLELSLCKVVCCAVDHQLLLHERCGEHECMFPIKRGCRQA
jgi:hypothetical protein